MKPTSTTSQSIGCSRFETNRADSWSCASRSGELRPVGAQAAGHQTDPDGPMTSLLKAQGLATRLAHPRLLIMSAGVVARTWVGQWFDPRHAPW